MMRSLLAERFALPLIKAARDRRLRRLSRPAGPSINPGRLVYGHVPMNTLCILLSRQLKEVVIDRTGLAGSYDIDLEWTPDDSDAVGTDIYRATRRQLGLDLERKNSPVDVYVIDHAVKTPVEN
jgi:uncharacterized protein (TIGR03435 family)